jgi:hypothetical protein
MRIKARTDSTALLVDVANGTSKVVYPMDGQAAINGMVFSADAKRLYVATDGGGDRPMVLAFDTRTLKEVARHVEAKPGWIDHPVLASRKGNLVGVNMLAGDHFEVRLLDATTLVPKVEVKTPFGSGALHGFSNDGRRATLGWSTAGASGRKLPVIVSFHGGPAAMSVVEWDGLARFFLGLGYAWIAPNVRGSQGFGRGYETADKGPKRLDAFRDVEAVGRWAGTQPWADKDKIIAWGGSYGGYTTLIALTRQPDLWAAGVDLFGIANLRTFSRRRRASSGSSSRPNTETSRRTPPCSTHSLPFTTSAKSARHSSCMPVPTIPAFLGQSPIKS